MVKEQNINTGDYLKKYDLFKENYLKVEIPSKIDTYRQLVIIFLANFIEV